LRVFLAAKKRQHCRVVTDLRARISFAHTAKRAYSLNENKSGEVLSWLPKVVSSTCVDMADSILTVIRYNQLSVMNDDYTVILEHRTKYEKLIKAAYF
jgi:hypothetical protein